MSQLAGMRRRVLLAAPCLLAQGPAPDAAAVIDQLRFARAMLCGDCDNDLEAEGVNRPARRAMIGSDKLVAARAMLDAAPTQHGAATAQRHIGQALEALESLDEAAGDQRDRSCRRGAAAALSGAPPPHRRDRAGCLPPPPRGVQAVGSRWKPGVSGGSAKSSVMCVTRADGGPRRQAESNACTAASSPATSASTASSRRLRTQPCTPSRVASRTIQSR